MYKTLLPYLQTWFETLTIKGFQIPDTYGQIPSEEPGHFHLDDVLKEFIKRMEGNYPFHQPEYAGQMLKPPHPVAWLAYSMAMSINPNNHALDGGPPSSEMEKEVISWLAYMVGYSSDYMGHLTSGGTVANLEALWVARSIHPGKAILCSEEAHYTHTRMSEVLGLTCKLVPALPNGKMNLDILKTLLPVAGTLVVTMGTTGRGIVEDLHDIIPMCKTAGVRIHIDAAYGGFFKVIENHLLNPEPWKFLHEADSIVIDPHKHGLQPYGCGCVIFKDASIGRFYNHDSPYTYFSSKELHLGEITLECSRAGASAAALWFTIKALGISKDSYFAKSLKASISAAQTFSNLLQESSDFTLLSYPETDIVCYFPKADCTSVISEMSERIFQEGMNNDKSPIFLSLYKVKTEIIKELHPSVNCDTTQTTILRSVCMKPSHLGFEKELMYRLQTAKNNVQ